MPALAQAREGFVSGGSQLSDDGDLAVRLDAGRDVVLEASGRSRVGELSPFVWIAVPTFGSSGNPDDGNQGFCTALEWVRAPREEAAQRQEAARARHLVQYGNLGLSNEGILANVDCPVDPAVALPPPVVEDAIRATIREQLPRPELSLPPGFALAGLRTYLVTDHALTYDPAPISVDLGVVQLEVVLSAVGSMVVDWGDGTVTEHGIGGTPYPDGPVNHVYTDGGVYDITTTDTWTVTYDAGVLAGSLSAPLAPVVLEDVEVQERQAVRIR